MLPFAKGTVSGDWISGTTLVTHAKENDMCDSLVQIRQFVEDSDSNRAVSDVVRVLCGNCNRFEHCSAVTIDQFEYRTAADRTSE